MLKPWSGELFCVRSAQFSQLMSYNPNGQYRFSPTEDGKLGAAYFGTSIEAALTETILRSEISVLTNAHLEGRILRSVSVDSINLVDISGPNFSRSPDIEEGDRPALLAPSGPDRYVATRRWAQRVLTKHSDAIGIKYQSFQDLSRQAVAIFESRVPVQSPLRNNANAEIVSLLDPALRGLILLAANNAGVIVADELLWS